MTGASAGKTDRRPGWPGPERLTEFSPLVNSGSGPTCASAGVCVASDGFCGVCSTARELGGKKCDGLTVWMG